MQDGAPVPRVASATVTVNVLRNFFAPQLGNFEQATINTAISEVSAQGYLVVDLDAQDLDRIVSRYVLLIIFSCVKSFQQAYWNGKWGMGVWVWVGSTQVGCFCYVLKVLKLCTLINLNCNKKRSVKYNYIMKWKYSINIIFIYLNYENKNIKTLFV